MSEHFNKLSPAEAEALALVAEECAEVVQIIGKILRHGLYSRHPNGGPSNRQRLESEVGDLHAALHIAECAGLMDTANIHVARDGKLQTVTRYLHHVDLGAKESP